MVDVRHTGYHMANTSHILEGGVNEMFRKRFGSKHLKDVDAAQHDQEHHDEGLQDDVDKAETEEKSLEQQGPQSTFVNPLEVEGLDETFALLDAEIEIDRELKLSKKYDPELLERDADVSTAYEAYKDASADYEAEVNAEEKRKSEAELK